MLADTRSLVAADPAFEITKATGSEEQVVKLIVRTFKEDNILMSVEEAAAKVEKHLEEEYGKLTQLKKLQARFKPAAATPAAVTQAAQTLNAQKQPQGMKTLTNSIASQKPMSARERAIAAFEGKLK
jgi:hypothetical protein